MRSTILALALATSLGSAAQAQSAPVPLSTRQTESGPVLVDGQGMTLYTFARDAEGRSACNEACAVNWPPLTAADGAVPEGDYGVIVRDDGTRQWTFRGRPLYRWRRDARPGDATGDGLLEGAWRIARP